MSRCGGSAGGPATARGAPAGPKELRNTKNLSRLDLVGIAQHVFVGVEDLHVRAALPRVSLAILPSVSPALTVYDFAAAPEVPTAAAAGALT